MGVPFLMAESEMFASVPMAVGRRVYHDPANRWLEAFIRLPGDFAPLE
ncbi:hypothetical protein [Pseudomonas sp. MF4836]|nr:hypothetical protein [Pseudomonas sp. MF4836]